MIRLSIRRPVAVSMAYLAVALLGIAAWRNIPIELLPDTDLPQLTVQAWWRGASPEAMEAFVTAPVEAAIQLVTGVEKVTSTSTYDQSGMASAQITVEFARGTDMDFARLDLSERLAALQDQLPPDVRQPVIQPYVPEEIRQQQRRFLSYTITGPYTLEALRQHVDDDIVPELLQVDGVQRVDVYGSRTRLLEIQLDERKVEALGLRPEVVAQRIRDLEYVKEAGIVEEDGVMRTLAIRHRVHSADDVRNAVVLALAGRPVLLRDVATVHDTYEEPTQYYRIDGRPAVAFEVHKEVGVNTIKVADRVKARIAELEPSQPAGVRVLLDQDESEAIRTQLTDLRYRALIAACVIFVVLLGFLRSFRSAGIVFATIAFSILIALNLIYFGGLTLNVLTLMGLAMGFGLIVDNAIVVLENVYRKLRARAGQDETSTVESATREVVLPILASTLTTVIVFIPFVYLQGELRVYYVPLAIVVGLSLLASLFVAFTFIPALAARTLRRRGSSREFGAAASSVPSRDSRPLYVRFYSAILGVTLRHPIFTTLVALAVLGGSYRLFNKYVTRGVLWRNWGGQQTYIEIRIRLPRGAELARTNELAQFFEDRLSHTPELKRFETHVYPQFAYIHATFPDSLERTWIPVAIKEQMVAYSYQFGGADVRVYGYGPSFYGGGGGAPNYSIKILGYNYETVRDIAEDLGRRLTRFSRIRDVDVNSAGGWYSSDKATEFVLKLDRARLALHGLTARDAVSQVASAVRGRMTANTIRVGGDELELAVKRGESDTMNVYALENLLVQTSTGSPVRLADVAHLEERNVLTRIQRENQQYQRYVSYEFRGPIKLGDRVRDAVIAATRLPEGYSIEGRQEWNWGEEEGKQIYEVLAVSLVLIFMVTAALFESVRQPFVVLFTVPMALVGVFLMFFYAKASFTREAYIGVIMMGGIVVNNAILLVDHVNHLRRIEGVPFRDAIVQGTLERVRPILMTSATTIFGLLPLVLFSEYADQNIWNALAFSLIGGLASSTFFVLTVSPAIYLMFERRPERKRLIAAGGVELAVAAGAMRAPGERLGWKERGMRAGRAAVVGARALIAGGQWVWRHVPRRRKAGERSDDS